MPLRLAVARPHARIQSLTMPSPESRPSPDHSRGPIVPRSASVRLTRRGLGRVYELAWNMWHARHASGWRRELDRICGEAPNAGATLLFLPSVPWTTLLAQRPQHMARALARAGAIVFYMVPPHTPECAAGFHMIERRLYLAKVPPTVFAGRRDLIAFVLTYNSRYLARIRPQRVVYDIIDDLRVFPDPAAGLARAHRRLLERADLVLASAFPLAEAARAVRPDVHLIPNAVDADYVREHTRRGTPPEEFIDLVREGRPIIGYHGALARWVDYALLAQLAHLRPEYTFVLIGPDYDGSLGEANLHRTNNVRWLGARPRAEVMRYLAWYDLGMLPFVLNPITHAVSALKMFEYFAAGKPVVSTPLAEVSRYPVVLLAQDPEAFALALDHGLALRTDAVYMESIEQTVRDNTWDVRAKEVLRALDGLAPHAVDSGRQV